ncbi:MAG: S8 family serine peptidase, partial [Prevotellaceae bacterium]|nr:S8 family serine peptidase [Prevotellaceae bacterium]
MKEMKWKYTAGFVLLALTCMLGVQAKAESDQQYIVYLKQRTSLFSVDSEEQGKRYTVMDEKELAECISSGMVEFYEPDYEIELFDNSQNANESNLLDQWSLEMIDAEASLKIGCSGQDIRIAVIDSGISMHDDLSTNIVEGYNYLYSSKDVTDNIGHGTFVSGLISAELNEFGIQGVVPKAKIIPLKCFDTGTTTKVSMIKDAIYDAVDKYNVDIINMSFGLTQYSVTLENAINYAINNGVIVIAAVGNAGTDTIYYPAGFSNVIGIGAVDSNGSVSSFSQNNDSVFVVAPGEGVTSTTNANGYTTKNGTSFSTPIVTGVVAIMKNINGSISTEDVMEILKETSMDKGIEGFDTSYGYGIVNVNNIIEFMLRDIDYFISPFDVGTNGMSVVVYNNTDESLSATLFINNYNKSALCDFEWVPINIDSKQAVSTQV